MKEFLYGAGYYPSLQERGDWDKDLAVMKDCRMNVVRTAELFASWETLEPRRGSFDFATLDEFFDKCAGEGMGILLGTGTASAPYWLRELDPDVAIVDHMDRQYPNFASWTWTCFNNPTYREESRRYITALVNRYKDHPALFGYQIHNETGFPFMPLDGKEPNMYCYCRHCKAGFRQWVRERYGTLERLNKAWTWVASTVVHTDWDMVEPPRAKPSSWASVTRWLDFRLYMMDSVTGFIRFQNELLKELDPAHPTSTNIFYMKGQDKMAVLTAIDQFAIAKEVDFVGYDLYPGSGDKLQNAPEFSSMFLDHARSIARPLGKPFWLLEQESGPINGWALGPHRNTSPADILRYNIEALGHGAKFILYQALRQWQYMPILWGGMVDLEGNPQPQAAAAKEIGELIRRQDDFFTDCRVQKGDVAILTSRENAIIAHGMDGGEAFLIDALKGAYRTFWEQGYMVDFITPEHLHSGYAGDYKAVIAPFMLVVDEALEYDIAEYVRQGGVFIAQPRLGFVNEWGWFNTSWPCGILGEILGVRHLSADAGAAPDVTYRKRNYKGCWHKEHWALGEGTNVLARFFDDAPAAVAKQHGPGLALTFATHADAACQREGSTLLWDVVGDVFAGRGIFPVVEADYSGRLGREIDPHLLEGPDRDMLLIHAFEKKGRAPLFPGGQKLLEITLRKPGVERLTDLETGASIPFRREGDGVRFEHSLPKGRYTAIQIDYTQR